MSEQLDPQAEKLAKHCAAIVTGAQQGIDWVKEVRETSSRVDREADALIEKLRRVKNQSGRLCQAAKRPMSIGFFGLSQAGKSYLISSLAAGKNGQLETEFDGERLDFIEHINPPGGGKEATGLVTRFTRHTDATPPGYPIQLSIFSETDVVKILGNSFFNDFNRERVKFNVDADYINKKLAVLKVKAKLQPTGGVSEDDMVDMYDYFQQRFQKSMAPLHSNYWPTAITLAPLLSPEHRAELFSVLWGEISEMSSTFLIMRNALEKLSHSQVVYAPLSVLVTQSANGGYSQADSIMNVDMLGRLGRDNDDCIDVKPLALGDVLDIVPIPRSILTALTLELTFPLVEQPACQMLETVDLLDFPGYRGRLSVENIDQVKAAVKDDKTDPIAELFLRGKVAYLFERYTDHQEMNVLIVCTPSNKQSDVTSVGPVLTNWIETTQGKTAALRQNRTSGLIWAVTMFDLRIGQSLSHSEDMLQIAWGAGGMMQMALLERFGQYAWVNEWQPDEPFNKMFLVRKPRVPVSFLTLSEGVEVSISSEYESQLGLMRSTFANDTTVQKHFQTPEKAWDNMLNLNDGGISSIADSVINAADIQIKYDRISEQVNEMVDDLTNNRLGVYFQADGAGELTKKKEIANDIVSSLKKRAAVIGELLFYLEPDKERLRDIYLRAYSQTPSNNENVEQEESPEMGGFSFNLDDFDLDDSPSDNAQETIIANDSTTQFIQAVLQDWVKHLREIPENTMLLENHLKIPKQSIEGLIDELIVAIDRERIEARLIEAIYKIELQTSTTRSRLVERQVLSVSSIMGDFIASLGMDWVPISDREPSRVQKNQKLFASPPFIEKGKLPNLSEKPTPFTVIYLNDWLDALVRMIIANAGHSSGRDITPEQNEHLGNILAIISGKIDESAIT